LEDSFMPRILLQGIRKTNRADNDDLYILRDQLIHNNTELLDLLPPLCISCKSNKQYKIWIEESKGLGSQGTFGYEAIYWVRCTNCCDSFEMLYSDYKRILPILKLNIKLKQGKITEYEHSSKVAKVKEKLYKKSML